ncbi:MAG: hypothetical protein AB7T63_16820 [Planctomycetota bacterium]
MRRTVFLALPLAAALALGTTSLRSADAALDVGDAAAEWVVKEMVNGDAVTLPELRGRVILYEFIGTG